MKVKEMNELVEEVEMRKDIMAKERDAIRENYHAMGQLLESLDSGLELLDSALMDLRNGIDAISEVV